MSSDAAPPSWIEARLRRATSVVVGNGRGGALERDPDVSDEEIAAIALGCLPAEHHQRVVGVLADDPEAAELASLVIRHGDDSGSAGSSPPPDGGTAHRPRWSLSARLTAIALATAASIVVWAGLAMLIAPPPSGAAPGWSIAMLLDSEPGQGGATTDPAEQYWSRVGEDEPPAESPADPLEESLRLRLTEHLLIASVAANLVLSLVVGVLVFAFLLRTGRREPARRLPLPPPVLGRSSDGPPFSEVHVG